MPTFADDVQELGREIGRLQRCAVELAWRFKAEEELDRHPLPGADALLRRASERMKEAQQALAAFFPLRHLSVMDMHEQVRDALRREGVGGSLLTLDGPHQRRSPGKAWCLTKARSDGMEIGLSDGKFYTHEEMTLLAEELGLPRSVWSESTHTFWLEPLPGEGIPEETETMAGSM